ncbi:MAG: eL32 family ribosomal protein [Nanobdellota archaeon]
MDIKKALEIRKMKKSTKPVFIRQNSEKAEVGKKYRKPKGYQSKMRLRHKGKGVLPSSGYRSPISVRGANPDGKVEIVVNSLTDIDNFDKGKNQTIVIGSNVGKKKKLELLKKIKEKSLDTVHNLEKDIKNIEDNFNKRVSKKKSEAEKKKEKKKEEQKEKKSSDSGKETKENNKKTTDEKKESGENKDKK